MSPFRPLDIPSLRAAGDVTGLLAALGSAAAYERREAATALGELASAEAVEPLLARLDDDDSEARVAAARALGRIGDARAIGAVAQALVGRPASEARGIAEALGSFPVGSGSASAEAIEALLALLAHASPSARMAAARAMATIGSSGWLGPILGDDADFARLAEADLPIGEVRKVLRHALGGSGWQVSGELLRGAEEAFSRLGEA